MLSIKRKICIICRIVFGFGMMMVLFTGGAVSIGFLTALLIGGEFAEIVCFVIYHKVVPVIIYVTSCLILLGLVTMYISGEIALTVENRNGTKMKTGD